MRRLVTAAVLATLVVAGTAASAQEPSEGLAFTVTPARIQLTVPPGSIARERIRIYNHGDVGLRLTGYASPSSTPSSDIVEEGDLAYSASRWITFESDWLEVEPAGSLETIITIAVPDDVPVGGYHALAFLQSEPVLTNAGSAVASAARIGLTVLLEVNDGDELLREARESELASRIRWDGWLHPVVETRTRLENIGDTNLVAGGTHIYRAWPGGGSDLAKLGPVLLLRGTTQTLDSSWPGAPLLGRVTVTAELVYQRGPDDLPVIVTQTSLWVIPWHLLGTAALLAVAAWLIRRLLARRPSSVEHRGTPGWRRLRPGRSRDLRQI